MSFRLVAGAGAVALAVTLALSLRATAEDAGAAKDAAIATDAAEKDAVAADAAPAPPRPLVLHYTFQPECLRKSAGVPCDTPKLSKHLDLGPQIAVWLEKADGSYVDTLMVTNAVAVRGIGNRPGYWRFPSNWHFPYGKRKMALPVWAHARGRTYPTLVFQDDDGSGRTGGGEMALGFHEAVSSPDPYFCLTFMAATWVYEVDAISCPSPGVFNSDKGTGVSGMPPSYYPPRTDLTTFNDHDCDADAGVGECGHLPPGDFAAANDLDAVAAATPPYDKPYTGTWLVPSDLPEGGYVLAVEVNKEFDTNAAHMHEAFQDPALPANGLRNNIGQPSVVWKVPFQLDRSKPVQAAAMEIAGSGDWDGAGGTLHPPGDDISDGPGTGRGRLVALSQPAIGGGAPVLGRVHVSTEMPVVANGCAALPPSNGVIADLAVTGVTDREATVEFTEPADRGDKVQQYEIRYLVGSKMTLETFLQAPPATAWVPQRPGAHASVRLIELKASTTYTVGARVRGGCVPDGPPVTATFSTTKPVFKQLHGCFIATAAYGSPLEPQVEAIRRLRDRARDDAFAAVTIGLYERASPPVAALLRQSETGRALVRAALSPIAALATSAEQLQR